jgi:5-methylcytosine-specific restriction endonuclease McrA
MWFNETEKRTLGTRDRQILLERANHRCEACGKQIDYSDMQVGHKTAYSKGGGTSLRNFVCLCYKCNKL